MPTNTKQQLCIKPTGFLVKCFAMEFLLKGRYKGKETSIYALKTNIIQQK